MSRSERSHEDEITALSIAVEEIPVVDFSNFRDGSAEARRAIAAEIAQACETIGFFYLRGHSVPEPVVQGAFHAAQEFFSQPDAVKAQVLASLDWYRGFIPIPPIPEGKALTRNSRFYERYRLQHEWPEPQKGPPELVPIFDTPNRWPESVPEFRPASEAYLDAILTLSQELTQAFALALGLPETRFDGWFDQPPSPLELLHYPPLPADVDAEVSNIVSHTDESFFTILAQDSVGGLEVKRRDGVWISAPPIEGAFTINVGDMLMWWSNGRFLSNYHRVRNKAGQERYSVPFFINPDRNVVVAPLPELAEKDGGPRYEPVHVGEHIAKFYARLEKNPNVLYT